MIFNKYMKIYQSDLNSMVKNKNHDTNKENSKNNSETYNLNDYYNSL